MEFKNVQLLGTFLITLTIVLIIWSYCSCMQKELNFVITASRSQSSKAIIALLNFLKNCREVDYAEFLFSTIISAILFEWPKHCFRYFNVHLVAANCIQGVFQVKLNNLFLICMNNNCCLRTVTQKLHFNEYQICIWEV